MNIGITNVKSFQVDDGNGGKKEKQFLEMSIRPPHMQSATYTITANKNKENENAPDFFINFSFNRKGENYPRARVGALWNKVSQDGATEYKGGHIESPLFQNGKIYVSVFEAKLIEGFAPPKHRHNVVWSPPRENKKEEEYSQVTQTYIAPQQTQNKEVPTIEVDEDEDVF
ncbi:MAG: hypothetical protein COB42_06855 [Sulfurimonas sp.]|nr:MAG: hypothetical protein COB42_06855 [Sulfurimonas sp.]